MRMIKDKIISNNKRLGLNTVFFYSENGEKPQNMCDSAWESMAYFVKTLAEGGGDFYDGWMKNPHSAMISCNDGFRPVSFLIETV